ncbi:hypothetical protein E1A91_A02G102200v1 [Gossypium mustelinum]|uniref:Uncharacterized protein n=1 Tax=Gossypium mustelinum TaxID=34275 RepID=A0A5D3A8G4_GOSMU|nr:hypothetical protein E1A91_A02G102200v1 [Gossypium mustelinum]
MTGSNKSLFNHTTCPSKDSVRLADGFLTSIFGTDSVVCTPNITLSSILHVLRFPVNLLSISTITKALNCKSEFLPDHCVFQDLQTGKTIGSGRLYNGLYILDRSSNVSSIIWRQ